MFNECIDLCNCSGKKQEGVSKSTQTNQFTDLEIFEFVLFSKDLVLSNESKNVYTMILKYINVFHNLLNKQLRNRLDINDDTFKIPDVPNYSFLSDIINSSNEAFNNRKEYDSKHYSELETNTEIAGQDVESRNIEIFQKSGTEKREFESEVNVKHTNLNESELLEKLKPVIHTLTSSISCGNDDSILETNYLVDRHVEEHGLQSRFHDKGNMFSSDSGGKRVDRSLALKMAFDEV